MFSSFRFAAIGAISSFAITGFALVQDAHALQVGEQAPDFTLPSSEGRDISLSDFKGKMVVIEWHNPECPFVKKHYETRNMQNTQEFARSEGAVWLIINSNAYGKQGQMDAVAAQDYYEKQQVKANHYLLDVEGEVGALYGATTTPQMFIIDSGGHVAYTGAIDNIPTADPNDVVKARNYVHNAIENLMVGKPASPYATQPYGCSIKYSYVK